MSFWAISSNTEPLKQYRWSIYFSENSNLLDDEFIEYSLKECSKPEYDISFTEHRLLTQTFKYPGLLKWKPITVKFVSNVDEKQTLDKILYRKTLNSNYRSPMYYSFYEAGGTVKKDVQLIDEAGKQINESFISSYIKETKQSIYGEHQNISKESSQLEVTIKQYDSSGLVIQNWELYNCFISNISYGKLSYSSEDLVEISLTIQYDYAIEDELTYFNTKAREEAELENERKKREREKQIEAKRLEAEKEAARKAEEERQKRLREDFEISRYLKDNPNERANLEKTEEGKRKLAEIEENAEKYRKQQAEKFKQEEEQERKRIQQIKEDSAREIQEAKEERVRRSIEEAERQGAIRRQQEIDRLLGEARKSDRSAVERDIEQRRDELPVTGVDAQNNVIRSPLADPQAEAERRARAEAEYRREVERTSKLTRRQAEAEAKQREYAARARARGDT